jgi:hypothetical protein
MSCPHQEPCEECQKLEASTRRYLGLLCGVLAPILAIAAFGLALELDPRANGFAGIAIGCVMMWVRYRFRA